MARAVYTVVIDQTRIDAPYFPRPVEWWQRYLPLWCTVPRWWELPQAQRHHDADRIRVTDTGHVEIRAHNAKHLHAIVRWMTDPRTAAGKRIGNAVTTRRDGDRQATIREPKG